MSKALSNNVIDLDLSVTKNKKFRIDGDDNRILELNTADMGIMSRISEAYPKLAEMQDKALSLTADVNADEIKDVESSASVAKLIGDRLAEVDKEMRELIDYIFDSNVSEITAPKGSMYDIFNGNFRFEYIISTLMSQYEDNLTSEFKKMEKQIKKHTERYTKK